MPTFLKFLAHVMALLIVVLPPVMIMGRGKSEGQEGPREIWEKVQVLWICRGVEVVTRGLGPLGR